MSYKPRRANGEGTLSYDKSKKLWVYKVTVYDSVTHKSRRISVSGKTKNIAKEKLDKLMYDKENKQYIESHSVPLLEVIKYNLDKKFIANIISESSYARSLFSIKQIESSELGKLLVSDITTEDIQNYLNGLTRKYRSSTIDKIYNQIKQGFDYCIKNKYIYENPMLNVIKPKSKIPKIDVRALTVEEQQQLTKYLFETDIQKEPYRNVFIFQLYLGLRVGEALALTKNDFDLKNDTVKINKTLTLDKEGKLKLGNTAKTSTGNRIIPIPEIIKPFIKEQLEIAKSNRNNVLFLYQGHFVHQHSINTQFKRILKNLKMQTEGISTHSLRHSYGTRSIEAGMPAIVLQKLMGHSDVKVTLNTYTSVFDRFKQEELEKVNNYYKNNNFYSNVNIKNKSNKKEKKEDLER